MDPLTRVTIERAFEAIMDAGTSEKKIARGSLYEYLTVLNSRIQSEKSET